MTAAVVAAPLVAAVIAVLALVVFQGLEARRVNALTCGHLWTPCGAVPLVRPHLWADRDLQAAAAIALGMALLARGGRRWAFAVPAVVLALGPLLAGELPRAVAGQGWSQPWAGVALELGLLSLPAAFVADGAQPVRTRLSDFAALLLTGSIAVVLAHTLASHIAGVDSNSLATLVAMFAFGVLAPARWRYRAALAVLPFVLARAAVGANVWPGASWAGSVAVLGVPLVLGFTAPSASRLLERVGESSATLLVGVNVLNIADALLTFLAGRAGVATEANPVVRLVGLPAKVLGVGAASVLIARWRPRLLLIPLVVLVGVLVYHLSGLPHGG